MCDVSAVVLRDDEPSFDAIGYVERALSLTNNPHLGGEKVGGKSALSCVVSYTGDRCVEDWRRPPFQGK